MEGVIFVAGVYGVGKSTMCSSLSERLNIDFCSAGDLISECNKETYGSNKKVKDKDNNQNVLVECVEHKLKEKDSLILAGHFCILGNDDKPDILPEFVYEKIQISAVVLLETSVQTIIKHLEQRDGKIYSSDLIESFIMQERRQAKKISQKIHVPLIIHEMTFDSTDADFIFTKLQEAYGESFTRY